MSRELIEKCRATALEGNGISKEDAVALLHLAPKFFMDLISAGDAVRRKFKGDEIALCSIVNARSGNCEEDCAFCPQSSYSNSDVPEYGMMSDEDITREAKKAVKNGAVKFGIVTSGKGPGRINGDFGAILSSIKLMGQETDVHRCASLGVIDDEQAKALKDAGLKEFHHNVETARSFYLNICSTRTYDENVASIKSAKKAGLRVCAGGIFGMGESIEQRVEMAEELKELDVESIPLNFFNPIKGTKLEGAKPLTPVEILSIITVFRLFLPKVDIKVAGGREVNLRDLQSFIFFAGANSTMLGNYLTTKGRSSKDDINMINDLGLKASC